MIGSGEGQWVGGEVSLCQVACKGVVVVGLGLHFLYSEGGEGNSCLGLPLPQSIEIVVGTVDERETLRAPRCEQI